MRLVVKHTFIDDVEEEAPARIQRSKSEPTIVHQKSPLLDDGRDNPNGAVQVDRGGEQDSADTDSDDENFDFLSKNHLGGSKGAGAANERSLGQRLTISRFASAPHMASRACGGESRAAFKHHVTPVPTIREEAVEGAAAKITPVPTIREEAVEGAAAKADGLSTLRVHGVGAALPVMVEEQEDACDTDDEISFSSWRPSPNTLMEVPGGREVYRERMGSMVPRLARSQFVSAPPVRSPAPAACVGHMWAPVVGMFDMPFGATINGGSTAPTTSQPSRRAPGQDDDQCDTDEDVPFISWRPENTNTGECHSKMRTPPQGLQNGPRLAACIFNSEPVRQRRQLQQKCLDERRSGTTASLEHGQAPAPGATHVIVDPSPVTPQTFAIHSDTEDQEQETFDDVPSSPWCQGDMPSTPDISETETSEQEHWNRHSAGKASTARRLDASCFKSAPPARSDRLSGNKKLKNTCLQSASERKATLAARQGERKALMLTSVPRLQASNFSSAPYKSDNTFRTDGMQQKAAPGIWDRKPRERAYVPLTAPPMPHSLVRGPHEDDECGHLDTPEFQSEDTGQQGWGDSDAPVFFERVGETSRVVIERGVWLVDCDVQSGRHDIDGLGHDRPVQGRDLEVDGQAKRLQGGADYPGRDFGSMMVPGRDSRPYGGPRALPMSSVSPLSQDMAPMASSTQVSGMQVPSMPQKPEQINFVPPSGVQSSNWGNCPSRFGNENPIQRLLEQARFANEQPMHQVLGQPAQRLFDHSTEKTLEQMTSASEKPWQRALGHARLDQAVAQEQGMEEESCFVSDHPTQAGFEHIVHGTLERSRFASEQPVHRGLEHSRFASEQPMHRGLEHSRFASEQPVHRGLEHSCFAGEQSVHPGLELSRLASEQPMQRGLEHSRFASEQSVHRGVEHSCFASELSVHRGLEHSHFASERPVHRGLEHSHFASERPVHRGLEYSRFSNEQTVHRGLEHSRFASHQTVHRGLEHSRLAGHQTVHRGFEHSHCANQQPAHRGFEHSQIASQQPVQRGLDVSHIMSGQHSHRGPVDSGFCGDPPVQQGLEHSRFASEQPMRRGFDRSGYPRGGQPMQREFEDSRFADEQPFQQGSERPSFVNEQSRGRGLDPLAFTSDRVTRREFDNSCFGSEPAMHQRFDYQRIRGEQQVQRTLGGSQGSHERYQLATEQLMQQAPNYSSYGENQHMHGAGHAGFANSKTKKEPCTHTFEPRPLLSSWSSPPFGFQHSFHREAKSFGELSQDGRSFTKRAFINRLSVITEGCVHYTGNLLYLVQFSAGNMSRADGVGFIFSRKLPCPKDVQQIVSLFVNRHGQICLRANSEVIKSDARVKPLEVQDWIMVSLNIENHEAEFTVWPAEGGPPSSVAFSYRDMITSLQMRADRHLESECGYFACVVKHLDVTVTLGS